MSGKLCPLCGAQIEDDDSVCEQCSESAQKRDSLSLSYEEEAIEGQNSVEEDNLPSDDISEPDNNEPDFPAYDAVDSEDDNQVKRDSNKKWIVILIISILIVSVSGFFYFRYQQQEQQKLEQELALWYSCIEKNTPSAYSDYIMKYPKGQFYSDAQAKITELRKGELDDWDKLRFSSDLLDYNSFLSKYPETTFRNAVKIKIDSLCWNIAEKENTADSYKMYINNYDQKVIEGNYIVEAQGRYDYLSRIKAVEGEELENIRLALDKYFVTLSKQDNRLKDLLPAVVDNFYGEQKRSSSLILKAMKDYMKQNSIRSLTYTPDVKSISVLKDSAGIYFTDVPVEKKLIYNVKKKIPQVVAETLKIELTPKLQIKSMYILK